MKATVYYLTIICAMLLLNSCTSHPFNPMAKDLADKWGDVWNLVKEYEGTNYTALMKEKMNVENDDKEKVRKLAKDFEDALVKHSKEMEGKEVRVELVSGYRDCAISKPWKIERINPYNPSRILISGEMEVVDNEDKSLLYLVAYSGNAPICVFTTFSSTRDRELENGKLQKGTIITFVERSPEIYMYQWDKIASITKLVWIYEDSEDFRIANSAFKRDLEFEERFRSIKIE